MPFGVNSPTTFGAGLNLLAAIPPHSKRLIRIDFAPTTDACSLRAVQIRISTTDRTGAF